MQITQHTAKSAKPRDKVYELRCSRIKGFILRVQPTGTKTFFCQYARGKRVRIGDANILTLEQARSKAIELLAKAANGVDPIEERKQAKKERARKEGRTLRHYLEGHYTEHTLNRRRSGKATKKRILAAWKPFLESDMAGLKVVDVERHITQRLKTVKPQSVNRDRTALLALLNQAVADDLLEINPLTKLKRQKAEQDKRVRWLAADERERFMTALKNQPPLIQTLVELALLTGLRRSELFGLTWGGVDFTQKLITVKSSTSKTGKTRHVPMSQRAIQMIKTWRGDALPLPDLLVFPSPATGLKLIHIKRSWHTLITEAKIENFHFHDCRHDFASRLVQNGVDLYKVRDLLGHHSIVETERYSHLAPEHHAEAVAVLDGV